MRSRKICVLLAVWILCAFSLTGCGQSQAEDTEDFLGESIEDVQLFPMSPAGYVGDPMPFYDNGEFYIFYLLDQRTGSLGYHPWALYKTDNFYEYEDIGAVIPYGDSGTDQDIALGTGSVIKDQNGLYHAFYTGHNDNFSPMEAVMHATSPDLLNWTKLPEDMLLAGGSYSQDDFRDPYVLYVAEENQYWMLVTPRSDNTGVIVRYTSQDLKTWKDAGIFFVNDMGSDSNMECPSLLQYQGKWYLAFSDQWPNRVVHYRVSDSISGPFEIPAQDTVDGSGFYAGRLETDGEKLYVFGWNATKEGHSDENEYSWAGSLVVHQLKQTEDGSLVPVINESVKKGMTHELSLTPVRMTETVEMKKNTYSFKGEQYEVVEFKEAYGSYLFETTIRNFKDAERFGFAFHTDAEAVGGLNIVFNVADNQLAFYNTNKLYSEDPQSSIDLDFGQLDALDVSMMISDGVVSVYVNDHCAVTARMYGSQGTSWGMFSINSAIVCENVQIHK